MYVPAHFAEPQPDALRRLIESNPLGALVINGPDGLDANHLPFEFDQAVGEHGMLRGHVARANPIWKDACNGDEVLVIFRAMDAYISPNWYPGKLDNHKQVPTWNYQVANVHGNITIIDDEKYVRSVVARLTRTHEAATNGANAWRMGDAPPEYIDTMLQAIVGIEITITKIVGKAKLSQNREERDRLGAADGLERHGQREISEAMRKR